MHEQWSYWEPYVDGTSAVIKTAEQAQPTSDISNSRSAACACLGHTGNSGAVSNATGDGGTPLKHMLA